MLQYYYYCSSWCNAIGLKAPGYYINVCYKHFSTGCPSRSCPNPDIVIPSFRQRQNNDRLKSSTQRRIEVNSNAKSIDKTLSSMVKVNNSNINTQNSKTKMVSSPSITLSKEKLSVPSVSLSDSNSDIGMKRHTTETSTKKSGRQAKKKHVIPKQNRLKVTPNPTKAMKTSQSNVVISSTPSSQTQVSLQPNMIATSLIQQPSSAAPSLPATMPAQILSSLLLRGCSKPNGVSSRKIQTPISITLPTEPLPRSAASQHKISNDLKLRQCPAIVAVAPATPRTVLVSPPGIPTVTMVQANTPPVSPLTVVTVPSRPSLPQKITLPQVPVPQSELVVQRTTLHVSLQNGSRTIVPSIPTPPSSSVSCESTMSGSSEDSTTSSANNSIILSPVDDLNNLSSNTLLDFDVFENSIDVMADMSQQESSIDGDIISIKGEIGLEGKTHQHMVDDSIMIKEEPIVVIKESTGALLDQSEDPCLNEGQNGNHFHQVQSLAGAGILLNNNGSSLHSSVLNSSSLNSTYLKCLSHIDMGNNGAIINSPFASDNMELDNVHRWLELCDAASATG